MKKHLILFSLAFGLLISNPIKATHIVGGEIFYDYKGNDQYLITLYLYLDCINGSPEALRIDKEATIGIFYKRNNVLYDTITVDSLRTNEIKNVNYACIFPPDNICVRRYMYQTLVTLPAGRGGYILSYQRCCRNTTVLNIRNQDITGGTYWVEVPERQIIGANSSPRFDIIPPNFVCLNKSFSVFHTATDADGDSLVYDLCLPYEGGTPQDPKPDMPSDPPYSNVRLNLGYGLLNFMYANPGLRINKRTGELTCTPRRLGQYVVGICVKEFRNGRLLSTVIRDFQINVIQCEFDVVSAFAIPEQRCDFEVSFENKSEGAIAYKWDFGDPTTTGDTSNEKTVVYTYPKPGAYKVRLFASSESCTDTFEKEIFVKPDTGAFAGPDVRSCNGENVRIGPAKFIKNSKYKWSPSLYLSSDTARRPQAAPPNDQTYILKQTFDYCFGFDTVEVITGPPKVDFEFDPLEECQNMTYRFKNTGEGEEFLWKFGTSLAKNTSTQENPYFTFPAETKFTVKLIAALSPTCLDSLEKEVQVIQDTTDIAGFNRVICFGDDTQIGVIDNLGLSDYEWSPGKYLNDSTTAQPFAKPDRSTTFYLRKYTDYCEVFDSVFVEVDKPEPFFQLAYTAPCDGLNIKVYNKSKNCEKYLWDFGVTGTVLDSSTSADSVSFKYPNSGDYVIELEGTSARGCVRSYQLPLDVFTDTSQFAGPNSNICLGDEIEIGQKDSVSFAKFFWTPADSVSDPSIPNPTIQPKDTGVYTVIKQYPECIFYDTVVIGVHDPLADFSTDYDPHCDLFEIEVKNQSKRFDAIEWDFDHEKVRSEDSVVTSTFPTSGRYTVSVYAFKEQCADTISRVFEAYIDTGVTIIPDSVICLGDSINLGGVDTAWNVSYGWSPGDYLSDTLRANPRAFPTRTTVYTVNRIFPKCTYTGSVEVRVANPQARFDTFVRPDCFGYMGRFTNLSSNASNYRWVFGDGGVNSDSVNESRLFAYGRDLKTTLYAIDAHCVDQMTVERNLLPFDSFEVLAPNIFTPNSDGYNDCYRIEIPRLPQSCRNAEVLFFNRWGQKMFEIEINGQEYCWDGTNQVNGSHASPGVYFYIIKVLDREIQGTVHLMR